MRTLCLTSVALLCVIYGAVAQTNDIVWMKAGQDNAVTSVAVSPDETMMASGSADGAIKLWDMATGNFLAFLKGHSRTATSLAFLPDGTLVSGSSDGTIRFWNVQTRKQIRVLNAEGSIVTIASSQNGAHLIIARSDGIVRIRDLIGDTIITTFRVHEDIVPSGKLSSISGFALSPDGATIATGSEADDTLKLWDAMNGDIRLKLSGHTDGIRTVAFSPDGQSVVTGSSGDGYDDDTIKVWQVSTGTNITSFPVNHSYSSNHLELAYIAADSLVVIGPEEFQLWDVANTRLIESHPLDTSGRGLMVVRPEAPATIVVLRSSGRILLGGMMVSGAISGNSSSTATLLEIRDVKSGEVDQRFPDFLSYGGILFKDSILVAINYGNLMQWTVPYDNTKYNWESYSSQIGLSPDGLYHLHFYENEGGQGGILSISGENLHRTLSPFYPSPVVLLVASPLGTYCGVGRGYPNSTFDFWDVATGTSKAIASNVVDARFSYDARRLALLLKDGSLVIWNTDPLNIAWTLPPAASRYSSFAFSYNSNVLATGDSMGEISLWGLQTQSSIRQLNGHRGSVRSLAFSRDDRFLVSAGMDSTVRTWIVSNGLNDYTYSDYSAWQLHVAVSPDSKYIASATSDNVIILWNARGALASVKSGNNSAVNQPPLRCYPIPSGATVTIECDVNHGGAVKIVILDQVGREVAVVAEGIVEAGVHRFTWDGSAVPAGLYHCRLRSGSDIVTQSIVVLR